jgi:hypothetical protein
MLAERRPGHKLEITKKAGLTMRFVPDQLDFGMWKNQIEAEDAFPIWRDQYQCRPKAWQNYCKSRGYTSVNFNV